MAFYDLRNGFGHHSGDIVDAPSGAAEFIDIDLDKAAAAGVRYVAMVVNSYTRQRFAAVPDCSAGWMMREHAASGEIFEPATVVDRIALGSTATMALPLLIDVVERTVTLCDLSIRANALRANAVFGNRTSIAHTIAAMVSLAKPSLYDLFSLHAAARGTLVATPDEADTVFSVASGTPFAGATIAAEYLA